MHLKKLVHIPVNVANAKRRRLPNKVIMENSQNAMLYHYFYIDGIHVDRIYNERTNEANGNATHVMKNRRTDERRGSKKRTYLFGDLFINSEWNGDMCLFLI